MFASPGGDTARIRFAGVRRDPMVLRATPNESDGEEAVRRFFEDVELSRHLPAGTSARDAVAVVLGTLLRRVTGGQARHFVRALPSALRDILGSSAEHRAEAPEGFNRDMYLRRVSMLLGTSEESVERLARDIFLAMHRHLGTIDVGDVATQLPDDLERLWVHP
jgi:uncharacterized protein (DUF2267 family)